MKTEHDCHMQKAIDLEHELGVTAQDGDYLELTPTEVKEYHDSMFWLVTEVRKLGKMSEHHEELAEHWQTEAERNGEEIERLKKENHRLQKLLGRYSGEIKEIVDKQRKLNAEASQITRNMLSTDYD